MSLYGETLPELPASERLAELWQQLGYAKSGLNGAQPFDWTELQAFEAMTQSGLHPAEASCLVEMSRAYCVEVANGNPLRKSPMERDL